MFTIEVISSDFHICKQEYSFVCAAVQSDLILLNSAWYQNALNTPGVIYRFRRLNSLKLLDLNALNFSAVNNFPQIVPRYIELDTFEIDRKTSLEIG